MLRGIDPVLGPELLAALRAMGHGDDIAIVDANFPAAANAERLFRVDGVDAVRVVEAIARLMPLDDFGPCAAWRMGVVGAPEEVPEVCRLFAAVLADNGYDGPVEPLHREGFYERARECFAVVATGEARLYGNLILRKGVLRPDE